MQRHNALFERAVASCREASIIKHTGDGFFARFATSSEAVRCALRFQHDLNIEPWKGEAIRVRIGIHLGEIAVVRMNNRTDVVGSPADVAARVMSLGTGGQVLVSAAAGDEARRFITGDTIRWSCHGRYRLKGVVDPVEIWEIAEANAPTAPMPPGALGGPPPLKRTPGPLDHPTQIGPYRILEPIGEGGMGTVYKAEQRVPVRRTVALKLIKIGYDTAEVIARFQSERQALARMDHPNVAKVLDAGADDRGRPFFVMEYVPGVPITRFADDNRLSIRQRLELFMQACDAISHAHSKALIHRDIKASNVLAHLADGKPMVKVIDFGIAKALTGDRLTDKTFNTQRGQAIGTYESMSPEQADGSPDIDTRTDVYSLGVLLYELLTGSKPFDDKTLGKVVDDEIRRIIREVEPPRPSTRLSTSDEQGSVVATARRAQIDTLTRQLRSELEWIPMMAMRKERDRRYASPLQLADDIRKYLDGLPLLAGPESRVYRLRKFARRNRAAIAVVASFALAASAGGTLYVYSIRAEQRKTAEALVEAQQQRNEAEQQRNEATRQRNEADQQRIEANKQRSDADQNRALAIQRFDEKRAALDQMLESFSDDQLKSKPGTQEIRQLFLNRGLAQYTSMLADRQRDPLVNFRIADTYRELGVVRKELGELDKSLADLNKAVELCSATVKDDPENARAIEALGDALYQLAQAYFEQGRFKDAAPVVDASVARFISLCERDPKSIPYKAKLGRALVRQISLRPDRQIQTTDFDKPRALLEAAVAADPDNSEYLTSLGRTLNNLGSHYSSIKDIPAALVCFRAGEPKLTHALETNPANATAHSIRVTLIKNITSLMVKANQSAEALKYLDEFEASTRRFATENPLVVDGHVAVANLLNERARLLQFLGRLPEAIKAYEEIAQTYDGLAQRDNRRPEYVTRSIAALALIYAIENSLKHYDQAVALLDRSITRSDAMMTRYPASADLFAQVVLNIFNRVDFENGRGKPEVALQYARQCVAFFEKYYPAVKPAPTEFTINCYIKAANTISEDLKNHDRHGEICNLLELPIKLGEALTDANDYRQDWFSALANQSAALAKTGRIDRAIAGYERARAEATKDLKVTPFHWYTRNNRMGSLRELAALYRAKGNLKSEIALSKEYLREEEWFRGRNYQALIDEPGEASEELAVKLRATIESSLTGMKRFTVPVYSDGVKYPFHVYITDAIEPFDDQVRWIQEVRNCTFPTEVTDSFHRLYKIAKDNNVSFTDLCVYALGTVTEKSPESKALFEKIGTAKKQLEAAPGNATLRLQIAEMNLDYARSLAGEKDKDDDGALKTLEDVYAEIDRCLKGGMTRRGRPAALLAGASLLRGHIYVKAGKAEEGYAELLSATQSATDAGPGRAALLTEVAAELGKACETLKRPFEAAQWYLQAASDGSDPATLSLGRLYIAEPRIVATLPPQLTDLLSTSATGVAPATSPSDKFVRAWQVYRSKSANAPKQ